MPFGISEALILGGLGAAGSIGSSLIGAHGASQAGKGIGAAGAQAAGDITGATQTAMNYGQRGLDAANTALTGGLAGYNQQMQWGLNRANPTLAQFYNSAIQNLSPYMQGGGQAFDQLSAMTQPGSAFMKPFDASMMAQQDPGYQFRLQQGLQAMRAQASATGGLGGAALRSAGQYSQGLASSEYQDAFNRYMANRQQTFGMLNTLAGYGANAADQANLAGRFFGGQMGQNYMTAGQGQAGAALNTGNALAQMGMQGNQWIGSTGLGGIEAAANARLGGALGNAAGQLQAGNYMAQGLQGATNSMLAPWIYNAVNPSGGNIPTADPNTYPWSTAPTGGIGGALGADIGAGVGVHPDPYGPVGLGGNPFG
jgi:hypothetical protein